MKTVALSTSIKALLAAVVLTVPALRLRAEDITAPPVVKVDPTPLATKAGFITSFAPIVEKVSPSVVTISTSKNLNASQRNAPNSGNPFFNDPNFRRFFGIPGDEDNDSPKSPQPQKPNPRDKKPGKNQANDNVQKQAMGLGSGVIVSADGLILTNNHVIEGADDIQVSIGTSEHKYKAKKIGADPGTDIAILKIDLKDLPTVTFGDSDKIRVGDIALAVGNPFGLTQSVSMGVISATGRGGMGIVDYENFIQTDASINPGNSGGALVDLEGRLIGINTAIFSRSGGNQGIGFAVPANLARSVMDSLIKNGRVVRGYLGTVLQPMTEELATAFKTKNQDGVLVSEVEAKGPAAKAGIQTGDVILEIAGKKVVGLRELRLQVGGMAPGTKIDVKVLREGKEQNIAVQLGELPDKRIAAHTDEPKAEVPDVLDGVTVADIDDNLRKELDLPENTQGVVITAIEPDCPSAAAGLKRGDVINEINRKPITTAKQAIDLSEELKTEKKVLLRVSGKGQSRYVVIGQKE